MKKILITVIVLAVGLVLVALLVAGMVRMLQNTGVF